MATVNRPTALGISTLVHVGVLCAGLVAWPWARQTKLVEVTPITLLTANEIRPLRAAEEAPEPQPAMVEDPVPEAPPEPPQPAPKPQPAPPAPVREAAQPKATPPPTPSPKAAPRPAPPTPAPKAAPRAQPAAPLNLDSLAQTLAKSAPTPQTRASAARGLSQIETDLAARIAEGQATAATNDALSRISDRLQRLWNPNCSEGAKDIIVRVRLTLNENGAISGAPQLVDHRNATNASVISDPAERVAADRALSAAARGSPYDGLPRETYSIWKSFIVRFNGETACRG